MTDQTSTDDIASSALSDAQPYTGTDMSTKYKYLFDIYCRSYRIFITRISEFI